MAKLLKLPNVQYTIAAVFEFDHADTMDNISGDEVAFGADDASLTTFDLFYPPPNAVVIGGNVKVKEVVTGSTTSTLDIGDSDDPNRYTEGAAVDLKDVDGAPGVFDMIGDHKQYSGSQAIRLTILNDGLASAGKAVVTVLMVTPQKANENLRTV
jgi:hypothetical protein